MEGGSLSEFLHKKQLHPPSWGERLRIACDIAEGMIQMHSRRFVHRDLKPDNVLLDLQGRCKVADLGLARTDFKVEYAEPASSHTSSGSGGGNDRHDPNKVVWTNAGGTPQFMSPSIIQIYRSAMPDSMVESQLSPGSPTPPSRHEDEDEASEQSFGLGHAAASDDGASSSGPAPVATAPTILMGGRPEPLLSDQAAAAKRRPPTIVKKLTLSRRRLWFSAISVDDLSESPDQSAARKKTTLSLTPINEAPKKRPPWHAPDAYAFAVILWQLLTLREPWDGLDIMGSDGMWARVLRGERPAVRAADAEGAPPRFVALMTDCWRHDAAARPTFDATLNLLLGMAAAEARPLSPSAALRDPALAAQRRRQAAARRTDAYVALAESSYLEDFAFGLGERRAPETEHERLAASFALSKRSLAKLAARFRDEMRRGLASADHGSTLPMLASFVTKLPKQTETGTYYTIKMDSNNLRCVSYDLLGGAVVRRRRTNVGIPREVMQGSADQLFDFIADTGATLIQSSPARARSASPGRRGRAAKPRRPSKEPSLIGFCCPMPVNLHDLDLAICCQPGEAYFKGWTVFDEIVGKDLVALLRASFAKKTFVNAHVVAIANARRQLRCVCAFYRRQVSRFSFVTLPAFVLSRGIQDTTCTLAAAHYHDPKAFVGVILSSGSNAAYVEQVAKIAKLGDEVRARYNDDAKMIVVTEWGSFGENGGILPTTEVDAEIDKMSSNPGVQYFDKMITAFYMGEIVRLCLRRLADAGELWAGADCVESRVGEPHSFATEMAAAVERDGTADLSGVKRIEEAWGVFGSSARDRAVVQQVCTQVSTRGARLAAAAVAGVLGQLGPRGADAHVGVDGPLAELYPRFKDRMQTTLGQDENTRWSRIGLTSPTTTPKSRQETLLEIF